VGSHTTARTTAVHRFHKAWRDERARVPVHAYVPMNSAPGEAYEFGWSHETITLEGLPLTVKGAAHEAVAQSESRLTLWVPQCQRGSLLDAKEPLRESLLQAILQRCVRN
jgi:hypothetical protein